MPDLKGRRESSEIRHFRVEEGVRWKVRVQPVFRMWKVGIFFVMN